MLRIHRIAIAFVCVLLAGCGSVTTKYPIGMTTGLSPDPGLVGTWKGRSADGKPEAYLHFLKIKGGTMIAIWVATRVNEEGEGAAMLFQITTGKVGENRFINAVELHVGADTKTDRPGSMAVLYRYDDSQNVRLYALDQEKAKEAIRSGRIAGVINQHENKDAFFHYDDVQITAEPAALDAFMAMPEAAKLFEETMVLKRVD